MIAKLKIQPPPDRYGKTRARTFAVEESGGVLTLREVDIIGRGGGSSDQPVTTATERIALDGGITITVEAP